MAYFDRTANEELLAQGRSIARPIQLGEAERRVILLARRDLHARRLGRKIADTRLEALRCYAMLHDRPGPAATMLLRAGFSPAERRIIDAMIGAIPRRAGAVRPATGRLVLAALILLPLLTAIGGYSWVNAYLQDRLIALVAGGLTLLMMMPVASAVLAPIPRQGPAR